MVTISAECLNDLMFLLNLRHQEWSNITVVTIIADAVSYQRKQSILNEILLQFK